MGNNNALMLIDSARGFIGTNVTNGTSNNIENTKDSYEYYRQGTMYHCKLIVHYNF